MRRLLLLLIAVATVSAAPADASDWSDYDVSDGGDEIDHEYNSSSYYEWCDELADADEAEAAARGCAASSSGRDAARSSTTANAGGRPPIAQIDESELRWLCDEGYSNGEIAQYFGTTASAIDHKKRRLGLTQRKVELPPVEVLQAVWAEDPRTTVAFVASELGVSANTLRRHFQSIGFTPMELHGEQAVEEALRELLAEVDCSKVGVPFALALLQSERGICARPAHVHRVLCKYDPEGHRKRRQEAAKTQYVYNVAGPRSLYHADAHEKLAKIWGFWVHLLIDGYSRYIIYLVVAPNKLASTVQAIFREACDLVGWAARVRWDKGTENAGAIAEQLEHHRQSDDGSGRWRGSAITGRSSQNCRAEYIWNFLKRHVSAPYRELFFRMMRELEILDASSPTDLFCLHAVFLSRIQAACDRFRRMWNSHRIRGPRTVRGHGGGVPAELWYDPVEARVLRDDLQHTPVDDDGVIRSDSCSYGVAEPFKGDSVELTEREAPLEDPISGEGPASQLLRALRGAYFEQVTFEWDKEGITEYLEYKRVCDELLALFAEGWVADGVVDWDGYAQGSSDPTSVRIRAKLAELGKQNPP